MNRHGLTSTPRVAALALWVCAAGLCLFFRSIAVGGSLRHPDAEWRSATRCWIDHSSMLKCLSLTEWLLIVTLGTVAAYATFVASARPRRSNRVQAARGIRCTIARPVLTFLVVLTGSAFTIWAIPPFTLHPELARARIAHDEEGRRSSAADMHRTYMLWLEQLDRSRRAEAKRSEEIGALLQMHSIRTPDELRAMEGDDMINTFKAHINSAHAAGHVGGEDSIDALVIDQTPVHKLGEMLARTRRSEADAAIAAMAAPTSTTSSYERVGSRRGAGHVDPRFCRTLDAHANAFMGWHSWATSTGEPHPSAEGLAMVDALGTFSPMSSTADPSHSGLEPEHSRFGSIAARAGCAHYPYRTGVALEHILSKSSELETNSLCVAMTFYQFTNPSKGFMSKAWPVVLARNLSIVVLTEWGDNNAPWELLRCELKLTPSAIAAFIRAPQLVHWYTQNWDLAPSRNKRIHFFGGGKLHDECVDRISSNPKEDVSFCAPRDDDILRKVSPLPIGMDLWRSPFPRVANVSASAVLARRYENFSLECPLRTMLNELNKVTAAALPFLERKPKLLLAFGGTRNTRVADYRALSSLSSDLVTDLVKLRGRVEVGELWKVTSEHRFVAAPASHGQDCFRQWEAMALGTVPITLHGPLDSLYKQLPYILIRYFFSQSLVYFMTEYLYIIIDSF